MGCTNSAILGKDQNLNTFGSDFSAKKSRDLNQTFQKQQEGHMKNKIDPINAVQKSETIHVQILKNLYISTYEGQKDQELKSSFNQKNEESERTLEVVAIKPTTIFQKLEFCVFPTKISNPSLHRRASKTNGGKVSKSRHLSNQPGVTPKISNFIIKGPKQQGFTSFAQYRERVTKVLLPLSKSALSDILISVKKDPVLPNLRRGHHQNRLGWLSNLDLQTVLF